MTLAETLHESHGATFEDRGGVRVAAHYGRPERTHLAVRNVVGVIEMGYGVLTVTGDDRIDFVDNAVSNRVPREDGTGCYALLCDPQGKIETDLYIYTTAERLLVFTPPERAAAVAEEWSGKTFIQDVDITVATEAFGVFGVYGPKATEKIASVLNGASSPEAELAFVRGSMGDDGVTVIRDDGLSGEEGYTVVCDADAAESVFDTLINNGLNAAPFGYDTWEALTLEAGTPLFESELRGRIPNVLGLRNALDFEKGCYVGQEVVSRVENQGRPSRRLVGLAPEALPEAGAAVFDGDATVGEVTRAVESPVHEKPIALALCDFTLDADELTVRVDGEERAATVETLPFVDGSDRSARLPDY
ncbi:aminomethyltransferase family protein [Halococcus dombrowskii]|uniref:Aminomethyltransferase family protein n=1 Tax=Halococcus dombrowskii TaxID=179637 RepID=A0AAV3SL97_HALDO|nr:aminomethyltransferase family protein [Halococcus dombrowskii]UOO95821.1 aminomethyltransferase family protein [Halococcus dombrowskii]